MILFKINQCDDFYGTLVKIRLLFSNIRSYCFKLTICFLIVDGVFGIRFVNAGFQVHTYFRYIYFYTETVQLIQGGDTVVHAAISTEIEGKGGLYLENFYPARNSSFTSDLSNQKNLFELSCRILKIKNFGKD